MTHGLVPVRNDALAAERARRRVSQFLLSCWTGISIARISGIELGRIEPTLEERKLIAESLEVEPKVIFS